MGMVVTYRYSGFVYSKNSIFFIILLQEAAQFQ